ncbi:MAG: hypothetical protein DMF87_13290 [Acidobacteria bacterium]|nr:MAG: hypothetical protein DMF88_23265 [Acidobacteriota bacterium]PYR78741.1 MAG: hypothetical protein DMF87_13290 [Acidobacteriota bacterium]
MARTTRLLSGIAAILLIAGCTNYYEIPIETPIKPKLDVSAFQRVLVAGFIAGGTDDVDGNLETTRLLRSQLRTKSDLRVIDTDVLPLMEVANETPGTPVEAKAEPTRATPASDGEGREGRDAREKEGKETKAEPKGEAPQAATPDKPAAIKDPKDLEPYEHIFADVEYWKKIGEEYQNPLIVTGTVMFTPHQRSGIVQREEEVYDSFGRRRVVPVRTYMERKGYILQPKFVFIDGRTGTVMHSENFREEVLYNANQSTPALSSYFELMDRLIPSFLSTLSSQKIKGTRVLLQ